MRREFTATTKSLNRSNVDGDVPEPIRGDRGASILGPRNVPVEAASPSLLASPWIRWMGPPWPRRATIGAQAFAVLGVLVGLFTIAVGVGRRTVPDVTYHLGILVVLVVGLTVSVRGCTPSPGARDG